MRYSQGAAVLCNTQLSPVLCSVQLHYTDGMESMATGMSESNCATQKTTKRRRTAAMSPAAAVDVAYVRRVLRKHRDADRRAAAAASTMSAVHFQQTVIETIEAIQVSHLESNPAAPAPVTCCSHESERVGYYSDCTESDRHSDCGSSSYDSDCGSASECSSGCWDATAFPFISCGEAVSERGTVATDDGWLEELLTVGSSQEDPWVAEWL